jgi:hypothetical protein
MSGLEDAVDRLKREGYSSEEVKEALRKMRIDKYRDGKTYNSLDELFVDIENDDDDDDDDDLK